MGFLEDRLAAANAGYKEAPEATGEGKFDLPEDGDYQAIIERFDHIDIKGVLYLKTEMKIAHDAKYAGKEVSMLHNLEDPEKAGWLKKHLRTLGLNPDIELTDLFDEVRKALDVPVEIAVVTGQRINEKTGKPYRNVYLNKSLGGPLGPNPEAPATPPAQVAAGPAAGDDDIPFLWDGPREYEQRYHQAR
jgi:hypothetical protein